MIRAMVVDDEKLVRKGFISLIDWAAFGIVMVGEASDGKSAFALLEQSEVDLLFTDITMPGLSGFDLIKQVRVQFPRIKSVVLTCHHEFDYVQEALRLGAIDYIVKTLMDIENMDEVLHRIVERMKWEENSRAIPVVDSHIEVFSTASALLFCPNEAGVDSSELFRLPVVQRNPLIELGELWMSPLLHPLSQKELYHELLGLSKRWRPILVTGMKDQLLSEVKRTMMDTLKETLFYTAIVDGITNLSYEELKHSPTKEASKSIDSLNRGSSMKWTLYEHEWDTFIQEVEREHPDPMHIAHFAEPLCKAWRGLLLTVEEAGRLHAELERNRSWSEWKEWFRRFSGHVQRRMVDLSLSKEVMHCLIRAVQFMNQHAGEKINQADVAGHVNMSRSYFSQCFARFAGESFGEMLRSMRIDLAKAMLLASEMPIYVIASQAGFEDDKYFSRLFRERVGKLPTEFRADGGKMA